MACDGSCSEKDTCLPFILSVVSWTFVLMKSYISSTCEFIRDICSTNCEIAARIESNAGTFWRGHACRFAVARHRLTIYLCRVVEIFVDSCMMEDMFDHCFS